jgi:hypothetical protein
MKNFSTFAQEGGAVAGAPGEAGCPAAALSCRMTNKPRPTFLEKLFKPFKNS